jgi:hypothetical protein
MTRLSVAGGGFFVEFVAYEYFAQGQLLVKLNENTDFVFTESCNYAKILVCSPRMRG